MQALLGKITNITRPHEAAAEPSGAPFEIKFKAACTLPQRNSIPEWLKDQTLTLQRAARDPREVGEPGDSIVLTPDESGRWLTPLTITPNVAYGELPPTLQLHLRWWKEEKLPEFTVRANGRVQPGQFVKEGEGGAATVDTAPFFSFAPTLPVTFEVTCDKLKAACTVLPKNEPFVRKLLQPGGEEYRIENAWYAIDITGRSHGGGIESLRERGRGVDHFQAPENLIYQPCEYAGHSDRFSASGWGWSDQMLEAAMSCSGARHEGDAARLALDGVVDEGQNLRTSVVYTLYDSLPLLLLERAFQFYKGKGPDKDKEKDEKPKEPIDEMKPVRLGFRAAWRAERDGGSGSRILCTDGERLVVTRPAQAGEMYHNNHWRMPAGWAVVEHPGRHECMMYLFDRHTPPHLETWLGAHTLTLEPYWQHTPVRPEESVSAALALTAGEICGATEEGAWVACRAERPDGGVRCAAIARFREAGPSALASFALAGERLEARLETALIPGVGPVSYAVIDFPGGRMDHAFDAAVGRVPRRK
jgi:hypothetical protein